MKTMWTKAKGLTVLCLLGVVTTVLALHLCASRTAVFNGVAKTNPVHKQAGVPGAENDISCRENAAEANVPEKNSQESNNSIPADLGITRVLTPIISEYLSSLLPRLLP